MSITKVREYLRQYGVEDRVQEFDVSSATVELAAIALHTEPGHIAKTLSFMAGERALLIVMAGDSKVDNRKFKDTFQAKPKMMTAEQLDTLTGLHFGGVCPFAIPDGVEVWLDESLHRYDIVYPACGSENSGIGLTPEELETISRCRGWVDVGKLYDAPAAND